MSNELRAAAERALRYMESVGQTDMYPEEWQIVLDLRAALAAEQPQPARIDPMQNPLRPTLAKLGPAGEHPAEEVLRKLACWLGVGGYNAPTVDAEVFHRKIVDGIEMLFASTAPPAPAEQPQPSAPSGWIACDERMPEAGVEVLVWLAAPAFKGSSNVVMDTWDEQHEAPVAWSSATIPVGMGWDSGTDWERITHWMPLPAAPGSPPPPAAAPTEAQPEPVGWFVAPHGAFQANHAYRLTLPPQSLPWKLPLYLAPTPPAAATVTDAMVRAADEAIIRTLDEGGDRIAAVRAAIDAALAAREGR